MAGPRLTECGTMNGAGSLTTSRHCDPTFPQINREGRTQSGGQQGRQSAGTLWPHTRAQINRDEQRGGERSTPSNPALQRGEIKPQTSERKCPWGLGQQQERFPASQERSWRDSQGPRVCTSPPTREPEPEGPNLIVGSTASDWSPVESGAGAIAPSRPLPHVQHHSAATSVTQPQWTPKTPPL